MHYFICPYEEIFYISRRELLSVISTLATNSLISNFMKIHILLCFATAVFTSMLLSFKVLQFCFQLFYQTIFLLVECSGIFNFLRSYSNSIFFTDFFGFKMVWLLSSKLLLYPYFMQSPYFCCPILFGNQLDSSCYSQLYCYFCWGDIQYVHLYSVQPLLSYWSHDEWKHTF